ncbi:AraC family transcriptional regulator [uncultured Parasphingorhabdus sp.]|uniref:AraC family transcriptional regulator n=1 Tax=uncultured Parasphingorhabdus sp. TaxID=2709694 RepID=UPI0030D9DCAB|tara:strand:+ start:33903 stop:34526 length:624 start_codon:yes stop_codon:yes gene_type:complete
MYFPAATTIDHSFLAQIGSYRHSTESAALLVANARNALDGDPDIVRCYLDQLLELLAPEICEAAYEHILLPTSGAIVKQGGLVSGGLASWQLRRVMKHVEDHLDANIVIEALADLAQLSPGHFSRAFKVSIGETPHNFIMRQRVRRAQKLMLMSDETLSQISCACGLTDQSHLSRLFRRYVGQSPFVWRRKWKVAGPWLEDFSKFSQ